MSFTRHTFFSRFEQQVLTQAFAQQIDISRKFDVSEMLNRYSSSGTLGTPNSTYNYVNVAHIKVPGVLMVVTAAWQDNDTWRTLSSPPEYDPLAIYVASSQANLLTADKCVYSLGRYSKVHTPILPADTYACVFPNGSLTSSSWVSGCIFIPVAGVPADLGVQTDYIEFTPSRSNMVDADKTILSGIMPNEYTGE